MTVVAVMLDPPREGLVFPRLPGTSPLSAAEATALYRAVAKDAIRAVADSGGDLLVNYRPDDLLPEQYRTDTSAEAEVRALAAAALDDPDDGRFEVQVGSTFAARVGNTLTHLLREEDATSAAAVRADTPLLSRKDVDGAAMKLRRSAVVLGPSERGRVHYAGFAAPIDFADAYAPPALETLTDRALEAGHDVDFLAQYTAIETGADLASVVAVLRARRAAGRIVPEHTMAFVEEHGLATQAVDGELTVVRSGTDSS